MQNRKATRYIISERISVVDLNVYTFFFLFFFIFRYNVLSIVRISVSTKIVIGTTSLSSINRLSRQSNEEDFIKN